MVKWLKLNSMSRFLSLGGIRKKHGKLAESVVNPPLFDEADDIAVIDKCPVPELHEQQGYTNHLFFKGLVPLVGRERALNWPLKLKVIPKSYHGDVFEGNACRKMLQNADAINDPDVLGDVSPLAVQPIIMAFKGMDKIVKDCFSTRIVSKTLSEDIKELNRLFEGTELNETLKIHVVLHHLEHCLDHVDGNRGLGMVSEQAGESIHRVFLTYWNRYKINLVSDPSYPERLKRAVVEFSSRHL